MSTLFPTLTRVTVRIDPTATDHYTFTRQKPFLLIDLDCPEVSSKKVFPIARANCTVYERMVAKYFSGDFEFDRREIHPAEPRTIYNLDTIAGVITAPTYLLTLVILEFNGI
jgi:hypothetical protein